MARYREIKKYGNSLVIFLKPSDRQDLNLKEGDMIDIEDAVKKAIIIKELTKKVRMKK